MVLTPKTVIGVFDSGVGGLSVLRAIWQELPFTPAIYLADQMHVPYGQRPIEEVRAFSLGIVRFFLKQGVKLIVVACNAASAASLRLLRETFPGIPFVGMEPAIKPAAETTLSGVVGVLATPATFQGELYASVVERFASDVLILQHICPGLVNQIENGNLDGKDTRNILEDALLPMLPLGIDTVVLGCTHYPFVIPLIQAIVGDEVRVIDPAPAVARQTRRLLEEYDLNQRNPASSSTALRQPFLTSFFTTGDPQGLQFVIPKLLNQKFTVKKATWSEGTLIRGD